MNYNVQEISINITRRCNLHCPYCYVSNYINQENQHKELDLSLERIKQLVDISSIDSVYLTGGEPFMHPQIKEIINYFYENGKKINIATNGLLLDDDMLRFLDYKNITLLVSLRDEFAETFKVINLIRTHEIEVICYHLPTNNSPAILSKLLIECSSVKKVKLLYDSKNPKSSTEWFNLLYQIYNKLKLELDKIDIYCEIAYVPCKNVLAKDVRRGAFDRIHISTEGLYYYCPLLISNTIGKDNLKLSQCSSDICPVLSKGLDDENFSSICCFLVASLENAIKVGKYGGAI